MKSGAKLQERGQVTLPKSVREALNLRKGDQIVFVVEGPTSARLSVVPTMTLMEMIQKYGSDKPYDEDAVREEWHEIAARETMGDSAI